MCIAALQNQAKNTMPTNEIVRGVPSAGVSRAQRSAVCRRPSVTRAHDTKIRNIHGAA